MLKPTKFLAFAIAAIALFLSTSANAQSAPVFGIGLNVGQGIDRANGLAIGGDLRFQIAVGKKLYIPITTGFTTIMSKERASPYSGKIYKPDSEKYIPLKTGFKYFFNAPITGIYGLAEVGIDIHLEIPKGGAGYVPIMFSPAVGYVWSNGIDIALIYEAMRGESYAGIRLGYGF